jgi:hypothetical protein
MPMSKSEAGRLGGHARQSSMTTEQRKARMRKVGIASAVSRIVENWPELTDEQRAALSAIFAAPGGGPDA